MPRRAEERAEERASQVALSKNTEDSTEMEVTLSSGNSNLVFVWMLPDAAPLRTVEKRLYLEI